MQDFSMHVLDIVQNSITAKADEIFVLLTVMESTNEFYFQVSDNGMGMDDETVEEIKKPFSTSNTTRDVGLGVPMLIDTVTKTGGTVSIDSTPGKGTTIKAVMPLDHIDRPPLGSLEDVYFMLAVTNPSIDFILVYQVNSDHYFFYSDQVKAILEDVPLQDNAVMGWIEKNIKDGFMDVNEKNNLKNI